MTIPNFSDPSIIAIIMQLGEWLGTTFSQRRTDVKIIALQKEIARCTRGNAKLLESQNALLSLILEKLNEEGFEVVGDTIVRTNPPFEQDASEHKTEQLPQKGNRSDKDRNIFDGLDEEIAYARLHGRD